MTLIALPYFFPVRLTVTPLPHLLSCFPANVNNSLVETSGGMNESIADPIHWIWFTETIHSFFGSKPFINFIDLSLDQCRISDCGNGSVSDQRTELVVYLPLALVGLAL